MKTLLKNGYKAKLRPSGHDISKKFSIDNKASIPPNIIAIPNTESNSYYMRYCKENDLPQHPARFPAELPEFFIRMLTDAGDTVFDPFAGSCVTGEVAERLKRRWICCDLVENYLKGALARFRRPDTLFPEVSRSRNIHYKLYHPSAMWNDLDNEPLPPDGGRSRKNTNQYPMTQERGAPSVVRERKEKRIKRHKARGSKKHLYMKG